MNVHTLRLSGSFVPSSRKLKMLTQIQNIFQTRVFLALNQDHDTHHTEGIRAHSPDFVNTGTKPHTNFGSCLQV